MNIKQFYAKEGEKPLDFLVDDGGFCKIFRKIGCIGDSLSSGEFESCDEKGNKGFHDFFEYSWDNIWLAKRECRFIIFPGVV